MMLMAAVLAAEPPRITISKAAGGYRAKATTFDVTQEVHVNAEIDRKAAELCAGRQIDWGQFGSEAKIDKNPAEQPAKISGFFKEFRCVVAAEPIVASVSSDWKASQSDETDVRRLFASYYAKRDGGDFDAAAAMFEPGTRPEKSTQADLREFNRKLGKGSRRITGVTWYVNPESAPRSGAYAALDFVGAYTGVHLYCGYLVFYRLGPGRYEIVREEQNAFERGKAPPDTVQLEAMRAATCRGN